MSPQQQFDAVIIGAGVAGLATAALLARDAGQRVLVLERAPFIGGRTLSYVGRGNKVVADGVELDARAFRKSLPYAHCYLGKCTPSIEAIFERGLLDGRTFEAGGHGLFWGNRSRVDALMQHLGVHWKLPLNRGLGFVAWEGEGKSGRAYQVEKGKPYPWMSEAGFAATMEQLQAMGKTSFEDMARLMRTPLQSWLEQRGLHTEAYDYIKVLAASQTAQAEPAMTPTGDFLGYMAIAGQIRMNLVSGSVATADEPGCIAIPQLFEKVVLEHGGTVLRDTRALEVLVEDGRATGVRIRGDDNAYGGERVIRADRIICTIPPKYAFRVLPRADFPKEWVELLERRFWGAGLLTGWCGMKRSVLPDIGLAEGSFVYDEKTRTLTSGRVVVAAESVFSNHKARDRHVRDSDFLDAGRYPEIVFEATGFEAVMENDGRLDGRLSGKLTLLGQTHPVTLEVSLNKAATYPFGHRKHTLGISARTTLQRSQWGMTYGVDRGMVGDEVLLSFELEGTRD